MQIGKKQTVAKRDHSPGLRLALKALEGGHAELARHLNITPQAVYQWAEIPVSQVLEIERITKVDREKLRPDIFRRRRTS
jgi:DNA-binding transcriptional regulator YdaS (Cro superfamily)